MVVEIAADLRALDHEVWLDQDLGGGQDWWDEILARIRWCDAFLPVLSTASLGSRACSGERTYALALHRPVLPIAVGDLGPEGLLDEDLARRQRIAYRPGDKPSTLRLLVAVQRLAAAPPLPTVEPVPPPAPLAYLGALRAELDGAASVDFDRQLVLLGRLSAEAEDTDRHVEVAALVQLFRGRRDVAAYVERQLAMLHERLHGTVTTVEHAPTAPPVPRRRRATTTPSPSPWPTPTQEPSRTPSQHPAANAATVARPAVGVNGRDVRELVVVHRAESAKLVLAVATAMRRRLRPFDVRVDDRPVDGVLVDTQVVLAPAELAEQVRRAAPHAVVVPFSGWDEQVFTRVESAVRDGSEIRG